MTEPDIDLTKCAICGQDALFTDNTPGANPVSYCTNDLPPHLAAQAASGQMPLHTDATKEQLLSEAGDLGIEGRSGMTKAQLMTAVAAAKVGDALGDVPAPAPDEPAVEIPERPAAQEPAEHGDAPAATVVLEEALPTAPAKTRPSSRRK